MPMAAPRHCPAAGHPAYRGKSCPLCDAARKRAADERRGSPSARGYDRRWQEVRTWKLRQDPSCQCDDCLKVPLHLRPAADVVDHIDGNSRNNDPANLRSMLKAHHDARTARDQAFGRKHR